MEKSPWRRPEVVHERGEGGQKYNRIWRKVKGTQRKTSTLMIHTRKRSPKIGGSPVTNARPASGPRDKPANKEWRNTSLKRKRPMTLTFTSIELPSPGTLDEYTLSFRQPTFTHFLYMRSCKFWIAHFAHFALAIDQCVILTKGGEGEERDKSKELCQMVLHW